MNAKITEAQKNAAAENAAAVKAAVEAAHTGEVVVRIENTFSTYLDIAVMCFNENGTLAVSSSFDATRDAVEIAEVVAAQLAR